MVGGGLECWQRCLPYSPLGGGSKLVGALIKNGDTLLTTSSFWPAPGVALGRLTRDGLCIGTGDMELFDGVGEEVEGAELDVASRAKIPSLADAVELAIEASNVTWHANDPLHGTPSVVVSKIKGQ
jgi:hypothetical protein